VFAVLFTREPKNLLDFCLLVVYYVCSFVPAYGFKLKNLLQPVFDWWFKCTLHFNHLSVRIVFSNLPIRNHFNFSDSIVRTSSRWWCQTTHPCICFRVFWKKSCAGWDMLVWEKPNIANILKSRQGKDKSPDCIDFSTGTVILKKKKFHPLPSKEYFFETFLEFNSCSWWVPVREPCDSQTLVYFHDHNISLQAICLETPRDISLK